MKHRIVNATAAGVLVMLLAGAAGAEISRDQLQALASRTAARLAKACPKATPDDVTAFTRCAAALRDTPDLPFASSLIWGGDQSDLPIRKRHLTHFRNDIFRLLYLSLFSFTGQWAIEHDDRENIEIIRLQAYYRNELPSGEYPYPFWHSAAKWTDYERTNEIKFYINRAGEAFVVTRSMGGSEAERGPYHPRTPPAFDGKWQWVDASGQSQPNVSLFSNKYSSNNPGLAALDQSYRDLALELRDGTCMQCHSPNNKSGMEKLFIFQTPLHAAAEIEDVLKQVRSGDMPQNDWGEKEFLDPKIRDALLTKGEKFRRLLGEADQWEARQHRP